MRTLPRVLLACVLLLGAVSCDTAGRSGCGEPLVALHLPGPEQGIGPDIALRHPGGRIERLSTDARSYGASISPDGRVVAFVQASDDYDDSVGFGRSRVALLDLRNRQVRLVSADVPGTVREPHWSGDGRELVFERVHGRSRRVVALTVADGRERVLLDDVEVPRLLLGTSDDGRTLHLRVDGSDGTSRLIAHDLGTGRERVLPLGAISSFTWAVPAPDGRVIAVRGMRPGDVTMRHWAYDVESGELRAIDRRRGVPGDLEWFGEHVVYTYDAKLRDGTRSQLLRWHRGTGERELVSEAGVPPDSFSVPRCQEA